MIRRAELIAFLLAAGAAAGLVFVLLFALRSDGARESEPDRRESAVYRPLLTAPATDSPDRAPEVEVLAGTVSSWDDRTRALEAAMRLHLWLALRDVHPTGPTLQWGPARRALKGMTPVDAACLPQEFPPTRRLGRNDPPLLGRALRDRQRLRVFLVVSNQLGVARFEAHVCTPGSRGSSQVFVSDTGREGPALREIMAWLTGVLRSEDAQSWFTTWSRPLAPDVAALRSYGEALVQSMDQPGEPPKALLEAASFLPEAAWAAGELSSDPVHRRRLFQRATALRPGFSAALENLAWEWSRASRPDLALLTLSRLRARERARPSELLLASRLLDEGFAPDAARLLEQLPPPWTGTTAARRLEARSLLAVGDFEGALDAASAWTDADPGATEAWLLRGDAEQGRDERSAADAAYSQALQRPSWLRGQVLARWAVLQLEMGRPAAVVEALSDEDDEALVLRTPELLGLRAFAAWRVGDSTRAAHDTRRLAELEPGRRQHRRNLCVLALSAGTTEAPPTECGEPVFADLFGTLMEAVWLSRRPFRTPAEGGVLDRTVVKAAELAPLAPAAAGAALRVLGPRASKEELRTLQSRWQLSRGTEPR